MGSDVEDTGEIVLEDGANPGQRIVEPAPAEWGEAISGFGRIPDVVLRMGRLFRLRRREVVSRSGQRTYLRLVYRRDKSQPESP